MKATTFKLSLLVAALFAIDQWLAVAAIGPNLWLKFDETGGITAADSSGNSNNAIFSVDPTWGPGQVGNGVGFDGATVAVSFVVSPTIRMGAGWSRVTLTTGIAVGFFANLYMRSA